MAKIEYHATYHNARGMYTGIGNTWMSAFFNAGRLLQNSMDNDGNKDRSDEYYALTFSAVVKRRDDTNAADDDECKPDDMGVKPKKAAPATYPEPGDSGAVSARSKVVMMLQNQRQRPGKFLKDVAESLELFDAFIDGTLAQVGPSQVGPNTRLLLKKRKELNKLLSERLQDRMERLRELELQLECFD